MTIPKSWLQAGVGQMKSKESCISSLIVSALKLRDLTFKADKVFYMDLYKFDLETLYSPKGSRHKAHVKKNIQK